MFLGLFGGCFSTLIVYIYVWLWYCFRVVVIGGLRCLRFVSVCLCWVRRGVCGFSDGLVYVCLGFDIWFWFCGVACVGVLWIVILSVFRQLCAVYFAV